MPPTPSPDIEKLISRKQNPRGTASAPTPLLTK